MSSGNVHRNKNTLEKVPGNAFSVKEMSEKYTVKRFVLSCVCNVVIETVQLNCLNTFHYRKKLPLRFRIFKKVKKDEFRRS